MSWRSEHRSPPSRAATPPLPEESALSTIHELRCANPALFFIKPASGPMLGDMKSAIRPPLRRRPVRTPPPPVPVAEEPPLIAIVVTPD